MSETELRIGDVVWLRSGGPPMTVVRVEIQGHSCQVGCVWHDDAGRSEGAVLPLACLVVKPPLVFPRQQERVLRILEPLREDAMPSAQVEKVLLQALKSVRGGGKEEPWEEEITP